MDAKEVRALIISHVLAASRHEAEVRYYNSQIRELQAKCEHEFRPLTEAELADEWMSVSAVCEVCGLDSGWRCKVSPKGVCEYGDSDDECVHCGHPDERK